MTLEPIDKESLTLPAGTEAEAFLRLRDLVEILRRECPWDREQDHSSLRPCFIEEAYEVAEAIDRRDPENLAEELGDVLLQILFHASLGSEAGTFSLTGLINGICEKMIRRHPHVFSDGDSKTVDKVLEKWENIKREEHLETSHSEHLLAVPRALPALIRSRKVQEKAARAGFDWPSATGAFDKLSEEIEELAVACSNTDRIHAAEELGDVLFSVVNVSRFIKVNPEAALEAATDKFIKRFRHIEAAASSRGVSLDDMELSEMDALWDEAKDLERNS